LQFSKFSANGLPPRTIERNVEQDHQLVGGSTQWEASIVFSKSDIEEFPVLMYAP